MEGIKTFSTIVCFASVCSTFIVFLIPEGNMKKTVNFAVSLFLMLVMIMPVFGKNSIDFEFPDIYAFQIFDKSDYLSEYDNFVAENSKNVVEREVSAVLSEICNDSFFVDVVIDKSKNGDFFLEKIIIRISESDIGNTEIIKNKIFNLTGLIPEVVNEY